MPEPVNWTESSVLRAAGVLAVEPAVRKYGLLEKLETTGQPRQVRFIFSDGSVDRDNDVIDPQGWDLQSFKANPVILWAHSHRDLPVGKAIQVGVEGDKLIGIVEFATHPFAETVYQLVQGGFLRAVSVGFRALEYSINEERRGIDFKRQQLLETSICPVPANQNALIAASASGIELEPLRKWMADLLADWPGELKLPGKAWEKVLGAAAKHAGEAMIRTARIGDMEVSLNVTGDAEARLDALNEKLDRVAEKAERVHQLTRHDQGDVMDISQLHHDDKGVSPRDVSTTRADMDTAWSAPSLSDFTGGSWGDLTATAKRTIAGHYAWSAEMPPAAFGSLKLPHHRASDGAVVWRGVVAATARLNQSDIPSGDLGAVKAHLRRHYAAFDQEVPEVLRATSEEQTEKRGRVISAANERRLRKARGCADDCQNSIDEVLAALEEQPAESASSGLEARVKAIDMIRWNKSLPASFDIASQEFSPQSVEQAMVARYCGCAVKDLHHSHRRVASVRMGAFLSALDDTMREAFVDDVRNLDSYGKEAPPLYETIQLNSTRSGEFLVDGLRFIRWHEAKLAVRVEPRWYGLETTFYTVRERADVVREFMGATFAHAADLKFLKGEAFSLSGEFLVRAGEKFDDLFLAEKNAKTLQRLVALINDKGADLENRGVLLVGPPGTGKTLGGRVIMNQAKATFIWLAARDFYYGGGFRALDDAFELARENAPTVLFIEDVDGYLDNQVTDLLKTTMDGLAKTNGVVTILTSNYPENLPKAIIDRPGRFHDVLRLDLPDDAARKQMLAKWLPELAGAPLVAVLAALSGYSGAHVREFARFVGIIREQDGLDVGAAADAALAKLQEQRDLITAVQAQGSRYRAPSHVMEKAVGTEDISLAVLEVADEHRQADAETFIFELADETEGFEIDEDALREGLHDAIRATVRAIVRESTERELNRIRGRVD